MQLKLAGAIFGVEPSQLGNFDLATARELLFNPTTQLQDLQATLQRVANNNADAAVVRSTAGAIAQRVAEKLAARGGVPVTQLFPVLPSLLQTSQTAPTTAPASGSGSGSAPPTPPPNPQQPQEATPSAGSSEEPYSAPDMRVTKDVRGRSRGQDSAGASDGGSADTDVPAPVVDIVAEEDLKVARRTDGIRLIPL